MFDEILECVICEGDIEQKKTEDGKVYWNQGENAEPYACLLYTSPSPRDGLLSRMPSSA